jgi:hypothetical protein
LRLQNINFPQGLTYVGSRAFSRSGFVSITLAVANVSCGDGLFENCSWLTSASLDLIESVPAFTFSGCKVLENVSIGNSITLIGTRAFFGCKSLDVVHLPVDLTIINESAFASAGVTNVTLPESVVEVHSAVFKDCYQLRVISIGNSIKNFPEDVLNQSWGLQEIHLRGKTIDPVLCPAIDSVEVNVTVEADCMNATVCGRIPITPLPSPTATKKHNKVSGGAIAGIVIGIVLALGIAGFVTWFIVKRRGAGKKLPQFVAFENAGPE